MPNAHNRVWDYFTFMVSVILSHRACVDIFTFMAHQKCIAAHCWTQIWCVLVVKRLWLRVLRRPSIAYLNSIWQNYLESHFLRRKVLRHSGLQFSSINPVDSFRLGNQFLRSAAAPLRKWQSVRPHLRLVGRALRSWASQRCVFLSQYWKCGSRESDAAGQRLNSDVTNGKLRLTKRHSSRNIAAWFISTMKTWTWIVLRLSVVKRWVR